LHVIVLSMASQALPDLPAVTAEDVALEQHLHTQPSGSNGASHGSDSNATRGSGSGSGEAETGGAAGQEQQQFAGKRIAVLKASKSDAVDVAEQQRSLGAYHSGFLQILGTKLLQSFCKGALMHRDSVC